MVESGSIKGLQREPLCRVCRRVPTNMRSCEKIGSTLFLVIPAPIFIGINSSRNPVLSGYYKLAGPRFPFQGRHSMAVCNGGTVTGVTAEIQFFHTF
jgi:hypothetical protein